MARKNIFQMIELLVLVGITMVSAISVSAGSDEWTTTQLAGYRITSVTIDPADSNVIYAGTDKGILVSRDGGETWRGLKPSRDRVSAIAVDPADSAIIYAISDNQLIKSSDNGQYWIELGSGILNYPYWVGIHPLQSGIIYVITDNGLFRSLDAGITWANAGIPSAGQITGIAFDPSDANVTYVALAYSEDVFRTTDGGQSWSLIQVSVGNRNAEALWMQVGGDGTLHVLSYDGILHSSDGGQSWQIGQPDDYYWGYNETGLAVDATQPDVIYLGYDKGLFRSEDGGATWLQISDVLPGWVSQMFTDPKREGVIYALVNAQLYKSENGGISWRGPKLDANIKSLAAHPTNPGVVFSFTDDSNGRLWRSQDGAHNWNLSNTGLENTRINLIAFDPVDPSRVYAGTAGGLYRSTDGGQTWNITGLPTNVQVYALVVDPQNNANIYVGGDTGLLYSINDGSSWTGTPFDRAVVNLAIDSQSPQTVYAVSNGILHRSDDGGASWQAIVHPSRQIASVTLKPDDANTVYVSAFDGVFISRDGGANWGKVAQLVTNNSYVPILQTDPHRPNALYANMQNTLYASPDAGANWFSLSKGASGLVATGLSVDAGDPLTLYATFQDGAGGVWSYMMNALPEPPTPSPSPIPIPSPQPTMKPTAANHLAATVTALAMVNTDTQTTAAAVSGLEEFEATPVNETKPSINSSSSRPGRSFILGGLLLLIIMVGVGFLWWQRQPVKTTIQPPSTRRCPNCGTELPAQAKFCIKCGQSLQDN